MLQYKLISLLILISLSVHGLLDPDSTKNNLKTKSTVQQKKVQQTQNTETGKDIFLKHCVSCHQLDGSGVPGMYPPLRKSDWVIGDKKRIISVVLNGLQGEIVVSDETYSQVMPKQDYLTDEQIAKVLSFIRQNLGNKAGTVNTVEVKNLRPKKAKK